MWNKYLLSSTSFMARNTIIIQLHFSPIIFKMVLLLPALTSLQPVLNSNQGDPFKAKVISCHSSAPPVNCHIIERKIQGPNDGQQGHLNLYYLLIEFLLLSILQRRHEAPTVLEPLCQLFSEMTFLAILTANSFTFFRSLLRCHLLKEVSSTILSKRTTCTPSPLALFYILVPLPAI